MEPRFATVIFDCDSTLSVIEGIDELAAERGVSVANLTDAVMRGELPMEAVYGRRLELARPSRARVEALGARYISGAVAGVRDVVSTLRGAGVDVRIISGGVLPAVLTLARDLGVPDDRVAAVDLRFDAAGEYAGFDEASPMARAGGKRDQVEAWLAAGMRRPVLLVGDGATDLEAAPAVDAFAAFAGVVDRPAVTAAAQVVIRDLREVLAMVLPER